MKKTICIVKGAKIDEQFKKQVNDFLKSGETSMLITLSDISSNAKIEFQQIDVEIPKRTLWSLIWG